MWYSLSIPLHPAATATATVATAAGLLSFELYVTVRCSASVTVGVSPLLKGGREMKKKKMKFARHCRVFSKPLQ